MIGSFKNPADEKKQITKYMERLRLKQKLIKSQETINKEVYSSSGAYKPSPLQETVYSNIQQELQDNNLQLKKAQDNLRQFFKYPIDAKNTLDLILEMYPASTFNQVLPEFIAELKGTKDLTPSYFANQFERFMTIKKSRGDNLVQIGINDDLAKINQIQKISRILSVLEKSENYKKLNAGRKKQLKSELEKLSEPVIFEGNEDFEETNRNNRTLLELENLIEETKSLSERENRGLVDDLDEKSTEWRRTQKAYRAENELPDIEIEVPAVLRATWLKEMNKEMLNKKREAISSDIINRLLGEKIARGKEVEEKLKAKFGRKIQEQKEREIAETEELKGRVEVLREEKINYEKSIQPIIEENKRIEEQLQLNMRLRENLKDLEDKSGVKINQKSGTVKVPKKELRRTKDFILSQLLQGRSRDALSEKENREFNKIDSFTEDQLASYMTKKIKSELQKQRYFEKSKLNPIPSFAQYLKKKQPKIRVIERAVVPKSELMSPIMEEPFEEQKQEYEFGFPLSRQSSGRPQRSPYYVGEMSMSPIDQPTLKIVSKREIDRLVGVIDQNKMLSTADIKKVADIIGESYDSVNIRAQSVDTADQKYLKQRLQSAQVKGGGVKRKPSSSKPISKSSSSKPIIGGFLPFIVPALLGSALLSGNGIQKKRGRPKKAIK